jgi:hypothetical protein
LLPAPRLITHFEVEGCGNFADFRDVLSNQLLLGSDMLQSPVDAVGQTAELGFWESPFFVSKFRWIESWISPKALAIRRPGG